MKKCSACGEVKAAFEFQVRRMSHDGRTAACKVCLKARDAARYPKEKERRAELMRAYVATPEGKEIVRKAHLRWIKRNSQKRAAHVIVGNAIRDGELVKKRCEVCGAEKVDAHHDDYSKPLDVRWLCRKHHAEHHRNA